MQNFAKFTPEMVNKSKVRRQRAALAAKDKTLKTEDETLETEDETLETEDEENSSGSDSDSSNGDVGLETITEEAFEEDNTAAALGNKDSLLKNTASAGTDDPTRVQSTIPDVLMEEDETIKVEVDPVDEFHYLLDMFSDENVDVLNTIIDRRRDQNVRHPLHVSHPWSLLPFLLEK
jgi:hypothetical protein